MRRRILAILLVVFGSLIGSAAQDAVSVLLSNTNNLRARNGLPAYVLDGSLSAAANNHAGWMAANNLVQHEQFDGANVRTRARNAGFPSSWVGENIYLGTGSGPGAAWNWWLNSPVHYAGLVSPNYDRVGIGSAAVGSRRAYVMVFGNSTGRLSQSSGSGAAAVSAGQPPYVLGLDELGNIRHEVQPGHTIGDIALIYGYTWDDIPAMLALNNMSSAEIRLLQPGSVFLVPPQDGTYTPTSPAPSETATATAPQATAAPSNRPAATQPSPRPSPGSTLSLRIAGVPPESAWLAGDPRPDGVAESYIQLLLLGAAILMQVGIIGGAALELIRRSR